MNVRKVFAKNTGFGQIIDGPIEKSPEREAIVFGNWRITYGEFGSLIYKTAHMMLSEGIRKGDTVAIISRNCPEYLIAEFAMYKLGVIPVKINWRLTPGEIESLLDMNQVHYAFMKIEKPEWGQQLMEHYGSRLKFFIFEDGRSRSSLYDMVEGQPDTPVETELADDEPSCHVHTSGTTGKAKGVVYTHGSMLNLIETVRGMYGYEEGQRYQFIAQLFHSAAIGAHLSLCTGGTIILMAQFSVTNYMQSLVREKVTAISVVPTVLKWILDEMDRNHYDLSNISVVRYSTCPIPAVLLARAVDKLHCRFYQSYGMTKMGSIVTTLQPEDHLSSRASKLSTVGRPIPGAEVKIVDEDGKECAVGETGEIVVKAPGKMLGYLSRPDLNAKAFTDGWYHTRDMGFLDEDGYLTISGRADDLIISGGENIYPGEVTNVIMRLNEDVSEVAVYGVPDDTWGEHVKASVVLTPESKLTVEELKAFCKANMPSFRVPKEIEFLSSLPKNPSGKVLISELKKRG